MISFSRPTCSSPRSVFLLEVRGDLDTTRLSVYLAIQRIWVANLEKTRAESEALPAACLDELIHLVRRELADLLSGAGRVVPDDYVTALRIVPLVEER